MTDFLLSLFADHGPAVLAWALTALTSILVRWVFVRVGNDYARGALERSWQEVRAAVAEVAQVYADAIKAGKADGKLTSIEKAEAKAMAIRIAKENIGRKGLAALARIFGAKELADRWIGNKVEAAVKLSKAPELAVPPQPA